MGRPSKLTPAQWAEIERRLLAGETARKLGPEFGLAESAIRKRFGAQFGAQSARVQTAARKLADANAAMDEANTALEALPLAQRQIAITLADDLREISRHLAAAARYGSATAHRLAGIAHGKVQEIDDAAPLTDESVATLKGVAVLTRMANEAATIGVNLLKANEETIREVNAAAKASDSRVTRIEIVPMESMQDAEDVDVEEDQDAAAP